MSDDFELSNGVRQGGILSGLLFNIYIDSLISKISEMNIGCRLGVIRSNIIAYADDIVLLAPSLQSLKLMINIARNEAANLKLEFNYDKTKVIKFHSYSSRHIAENRHLNPILINDHAIEFVSSLKYLGFMISNNLNNSDDINRVLKKFYSEFNSILRKFHFASKEVKLYLFKQYCLQFYGSDLWFGPFKSSQAIKQFEVGYHNAVKKLLGLSTHESNHFACQEARLLVLNHLLNKKKICSALNFILNPCDFICKILKFMKLSSYLVNDVCVILRSKYNIESLFDNDIEAIISRISYVQNHENQMRVSW